MAITAALRTDGNHAVTVTGLIVQCYLCAFPQPGPSTFVFTQLLDATVRQEVTCPIPADPGTIWPLGSVCQPPPFGSSVPDHFHTVAATFTLLPPGVGVDSFRLRLMDGVTVVFDEPFVY